MEHISKKHYYPNDFVHGLLSAHIADETGIEADNPLVNEGDMVHFSDSNLLYQLFLGIRNLDLNHYLSKWKVLSVVKCKESGYLGIIY